MEQKKKRKYTKSPKVGQGKRGMPQTGGTKNGDMIKNTRVLLARIQKQMDVLDEKYGMSLMEKAYKMIHEDGTQDFVRKDLILGLLKLVTPSMKAIDVSADKAPVAIQFNTNLTATHGTDAANHI